MEDDAGCFMLNYLSDVFKYTNLQETFLIQTITGHYTFGVQLHNVYMPHARMKYKIHR